MTELLLGVVHVNIQMDSELFHLTLSQYFCYSVNGKLLFCPEYLLYTFQAFTFSLTASVV
jgi:hypothetical protein